MKESVLVLIAFFLHMYIVKYNLLAEKPLYEWNPNEAMNHSPDAIQAMQYMANTFGMQQISSPVCEIYLIQYRF